MSGDNALSLLIACSIPGCELLKKRSVKDWIFASPENHKRNLRSRDRRGRHGDLRSKSYRADFQEGAKLAEGWPARDRRTTDARK